MSLRRTEWLLLALALLPLAAGPDGRVPAYGTWARDAAIRAAVAAARAGAK